MKKLTAFYEKIKKIFLMVCIGVKSNTCKCRMRLKTNETLVCIGVKSNACKWSCAKMVVSGGKMCLNCKIRKKDKKYALKNLIKIKKYNMINFRT